MRSTRGLTFAALAILAASSCENPTDPMPAAEPGPETWAPSMSVVSGVPSVCGAPKAVNLMLGPNIQSGSVEVANDEANLYVTFRSESWRSILATAVFVGDSPDDIPTTRRGLPRLLQFPYRSGHGLGTTEVVWEIPLSEDRGDEVVIAAFAQIGLLPSWGEGEPITTGRDWAMYFTHVVAACEDEPDPEPVGPDGGTVSTEGGEAMLTVPAGALEAPTSITIAPATVQDLFDQAPPEEVDPELGTLFGVTPIQGTIWNLQPDGLRFLEPAAIVLYYDESALPAGLSEEDLGAYAINGIYEPLPSTVDTEANTVTAQISHFTFVFTAIQNTQLVDLEVTGLSLLSEPVASQPLDVRADVRNNGPGVTTGLLTFVVRGNVTLGEVAASCADATVPQGSVTIECDLPLLQVGVTASRVIRFIPNQGGETVSVTAIVSAGTNEDNAEGNDQHAVAFSVIGEGATVDLTAIRPGIAIGSETIIGGLMGFIGRVDNLGPGASNGGTLLFEAFGDVVPGDVPADCTEIADPAPAAAAIRCTIDPLERSGIDLSGPFRLIAQSEGSVEILTTVSPGGGDVDVNPNNDVALLNLPVSTTYQVGLAPFLPTVTGVREIGERVRFQASVSTLGPHYSNGGELIYEAEGDVVLGDVDPACTVSGSLTVSCPFGPIFAAIDPLGALEVIPQSDGVVTFRATTVPVAGDTDVNPDNDQIETSILVGPPPEADLGIRSFGPGVSPTVVGQPIDFIAIVENLGPDTAPGATLMLSATGDVTLGAVRGACTSPVPGVAAVSCPVEALMAGDATAGGQLQIIAHSEGPVTVVAQVQASIVDRNPLNNSAVVVVSIDPAE